VSVHNTTIYFIYIKNSILSRRHVSTFTGPSSGPQRKQIQDYTDLCKKIYLILDLFSLRAWRWPSEGRKMSPWQYTIFNV